MTLEEFEMLTDEQKRQALAYQETYEEYKDLEAKSMIFKCKPTYNFQSVEFEWEGSCDEDLEAMFNLYDHIVKRLQEIAPEQDTKPVRFKTTKPKQKMASEAQLDYMDALGIKHPSNCSSATAMRLLSSHLDGKEE